jgi:hypothetical protein
VPQPTEEILGRRSLGGGILELSAEAHTPAIAIRRKIAMGLHFQSRRFSNTETASFFPAPAGPVRPGQIRGSSWSSAATTARSSRSRS